MIIILL